MIEQKNLLTNGFAFLLIIISCIIPESLFSEMLASAGYFAISGALTNWLAIHMLFERVPFLYGSGVIENQFQTFKQAIKDLFLEQFFNPENIERFLHDSSSLDTSTLEAAVFKKIDYDQVYYSLVDVIMSSKFSGMISILGGRSALSSLKEPVTQKVKKLIQDAVNPKTFEVLLKDSLLPKTIMSSIEQIVDRRVAELTPKMVKKIMQEMILHHLGWLVVWGGVFGGLIGMIVRLIALL